MTHPSEDIHLPALFRKASDAELNGVLRDILADSQWLDAVTQASLVVGRPLPEAKRAFDQMLRKEADPGDRAVLLTAVARCHNSQMRLLDGARLLKKAWQLLRGIRDDRRAYVQLEMARFQLLTGNLDSARTLLTGLYDRAESEYLRRLALYYDAAVRVSTGDLDVVPLLEASLAWFESRGHASTAVAHLRMLASLRSAAGEEAAAHELLDRGAGLCTGPGLNFCKALLHNDKAQLYHAAGDTDAVERELQESLAQAEFPYSRIDTLDLRGRFLLDDGAPDMGLPYLLEALELARGAGTLVILPSLAYHIGLCYEKLEQLALARHFHQQGYSSALQLLEHGFPATETRLKAIRAHVQMLGAQPALAAGKSGGPATGMPDFSFALGRSLKEIRTLFQMALLEDAAQAWGTQLEGVRRMGLAARTAGNVKRRYRELGKPELPALLREVARSRRELDWKESTTRFEDDLLLWMADRYKGRLRELSAELVQSYAHLSSRISQARRRSASGQED